MTVTDWTLLFSIAGFLFGFLAWCTAIRIERRLEKGFKIQSASFEVWEKDAGDWWKRGGEPSEN